MTPEERRQDIASRFWTHMKQAAQAITNSDREAVVLEWNVLVGMLDHELTGRQRDLARGMVRALQEKKAELERGAKPTPPASSRKRRRK